RPNFHRSCRGNLFQIRVSAECDLLSVGHSVTSSTAPSRERSKMVGRHRLPHGRLVRQTCDGLCSRDSIISFDHPAALMNSRRLTLRFGWSGLHLVVTQTVSLRAKLTACATDSRMRFVLP